MRVRAGMIIAIAALLVFLVGCGKKDAADVVADLDKTVAQMKGYQGSGTMVLHSGEKPLEYEVEVWYKAPDSYRIALTNSEKDITQIVLRNEEGVFVLTPHLNKSFRFQSNWPNENGQVYLFQSLAQSIVLDEQRQFTVDEENKAYVFDVNANYQNSSLTRQKIWLDQKSYAPRYVEVSNENAIKMVEVEFQTFNFNPEFDADAFDMKRNLSAWNILSVPTMVDQLEKKQEAEAQPASFGIIEPSYVPEGVTQASVSDVEWGEQQAVMLRYSGTYNYTLLEARPEAKSVTAMWGDVVDLGYTMGVFVGGDSASLHWVADGIEYRLTSADLPRDEMVRIAQSVEGQIGK